jgi:hypothetical protein
MSAYIVAMGTRLLRQVEANTEVQAKARAIAAAEAQLGDKVTDKDITVIEVYAIPDDCRTTTVRRRGSK